MKIAVIHESTRVTETSRDILIQIKNRGLEATYLRVSKLGVLISERITPVYGRKELHIDAGVIRNLGFIYTTEQLIRRIDTLKTLKNLGVTLINDPDSMLIARDKYGSLIALKRKGIPIPDTAVVESPFETMKLVEKWGEVVLKPLMGSLGLGIVRVSDPDIAFRVARAIASVNQPIYVQKYIHKPDRDIRIIVIGDTVLGGIYRYNKENWKTNIAQGSFAQAIAVNRELTEIALRATEALGLDYAGLDIAEGTDGYKVLEVNGAPMWKGFRLSTGIDPSSYIVDHLIRKAKR